VAGQAPVTYQYDVASRLIQVAQGSLTVGIGYDAAGRRTSLTYPNGTSTTYSYDNANRLTAITHNGPSGLIESLNYVYDAAGNRIGLTRTNGTASLLPNAVASASYDAANEQTQFSGATLTYDQNGNLTNDGTNTYTWDARNRLTAISGGVTASFSYDALGRRVSKTINGEPKQFLYDGNDVVAELSGGTVSASYVRSLDIDDPFIRQTSSNEFYHADALSGTTALSSNAGAVQTTSAYEAFGNTSVTGTSENAFQYAGRENDNTGLYYYRARYYSPIEQRFLSEDPTGLRGGDPNLYGYVFNNPVNRVDPTGEITPLLPTLPALVEVISTLIGTVSGVTSGQAIGIIGATTVIGIGATSGSVRRDSIDEAIAKAPVPPFPQIKDIKKDCVPGRRIVEPSTSVKGGTSVEQEYICKNGVFWRHTLLDKNNKIANGHDHFRPYGPTGGAD
jgi:RHS repeat-associated protein